MFTGIVQGVAQVMQVRKENGFWTIFLGIPTQDQNNLKIGASVSVDGVCLTVTSMKDGLVGFDIINNSLKITTLDGITVGQYVNYERSLLAESEIGGHILSGHIDFSATVTEIESGSGNYGVTISTHAKGMAYIFEKGFIGINGASLTVSDVNKTKQTFTCWLIPETLARTTFRHLRVGMTVNIEVDRNTQILVDTLTSIAEEKFGSLSQLVLEAAGKLNLVQDLRNSLEQAKSTASSTLKGKLPKR